MKIKTIRISTKMDEVDNVQQSKMTRAHFEWFYQRLFLKFIMSLEDDFGFKGKINFDINENKNEMFIEIKEEKL